MFLSLPDPELQIAIRKALNEDLDTREQYLEKIKEWLRQQPHLPDNWDDEPRLVNFLRGCNFSLQKCKSKLEAYFTMRTVFPEVFTNRDISRPELQDLMKTAMRFAVLPELTPDGKRVSIISPMRRDFETPSVIDSFKIIVMTADVRLELEKHGILGDVCIFDCDVDYSKHWFNVPLVTVKKCLMCLQKAYPMKTKEVHLINMGAGLDKVVNLAKTMLNEKMRNRFHSHSNLESLHRFVPKHILPEEYGGTAGKIEDMKAQWLKVLEEYTPWFKEQENIKADLSKKPQNGHVYEDLFGLDGSFRQLSID